MSWESGLQRLPDGTYVDRPRPARHFFVMVGAPIPLMWIYFPVAAVWMKSPFLWLLPMLRGLTVWGAATCGMLSN